MTVVYFCVLCYYHLDTDLYIDFFFLWIRRPPRSTLTATLFPTRRSSDLIRFLALLDQRTHPIGLPVRGDMPAERLDNIAEPILRDHARLDRLASDRKSTRLNSSH